MLELVHNDPQGWLRNFLNRTPVPARASPGVGYIYVLQVTGPASYVKVGATAQPRTRFETLDSEAHRLGSAVTGVWLSPAHPAYHRSEAQALRACRELSPSSTPRGEYFPGLSFSTARSEAVKAILGFHDTPGPPPLLPSAGLHEALPEHVQRLLRPASQDIYRRRRNRFAQGSYRTRFSRRNEPTAAIGPLDSDPLLDELARQLFAPTDSMPDLTSRRATSRSANAVPPRSDRSD